MIDSRYKYWAEFVEDGVAGKLFPIVPAADGESGKCHLPRGALPGMYVRAAADGVGGGSDVSLFLSTGQWIGGKLCDAVEYSAE